MLAQSCPWVGLIRDRQTDRQTHHAIFEMTAYLYCAVRARAVKTADSIDVQFAMKTRVSPMNHVLGGRPDPLSGEEGNFGVIAALEMP